MGTILGWLVWGADKGFSGYNLRVVWVGCG